MISMRGESKASSFLFETGGLCIAHLGDLGSPMNPEQLRRLGKIHVALAIISDPGAMNPRVMADFVQRLGPNVAIPMDRPLARGVECVSRRLQARQENRGRHLRLQPQDAAAPHRGGAHQAQGLGVEIGISWVPTLLVIPSTASAFACRRGTGPCACPTPRQHNPSFFNRD